MTSEAVAVTGNGPIATHKSGRAADMMSRLRILVFIALPVVLFALGVAVATILALGWMIQHVA